MKAFAALLALATILLPPLLASPTLAQDIHWPHSLPRTEKHYPEYESHQRRLVEVQEKLAWRTPTGVKKMSGDEGEMFFPDYWVFDEEKGLLSTGRWDSRPSRTMRHMNDLEGYTNGSGSLSLRPVIGLHQSRKDSFIDLLGRNIFGRDFQCPGGTKSCSSIGQPDLCCNNDETCVKTSSGAGCCPSGETCGNEVAGCNTDDGYTSCPNSSGGGCCVPGAKCEGTGCVFYGTSTLTTTLPTSTATSGASFSTETSDGSTVTIASIDTATSVSVSEYTTTVTVTDSPSGSTATQTVVLTSTSKSQSCSTGFFSCAASLGGGCCRTGQTCATGNQCSDVTSSTATPSAPILPTSISSDTSSSTSSITSTSTTTASSNGVCPTGFYACSAYYLGGCCRVGRNCDTTSCPPGDATTVVSSSLTVVVTNGATVATGPCANGWASCPASAGGGCCPSGYACGQSCTATASGEQNTGKMAPSSANVVGWAWGLGILGITSACLMMML